jgi:hypothetical protein
MTLVVCWKQNDEINCVADTRISGEHVTITDSGAKIFIVPIVTYLPENSSFGLATSHSYGFAFAGSTLAALNTHALVSSCTQQLFNKDRRTPPSIRSVAELYAKVGTHYLRDLNFAKNQNFITFTGLLFGFCPSSRKFQVYSIDSHVDSIPFGMSVHEHNISGSKRVVFGSGSAAFSDCSKARVHRGESDHPMDVFSEVLLSGSVKSVGGYPQYGTARKEGMSLRPLLMPSEKDVDVATTTILGLDLCELGKVDDFDIGFEAIGFQLETRAARRALRDKGIDPDAGPVKQSVQNLASLELMLKALLNSRDKPQYALIDRVCTVERIRPAMTKWYFVVACANCGTKTPLCEDPSNGQLENPFRGPGAIKTSCWNCQEAVEASASQIRPEQWKYPT